MTFPVGLDLGGRRALVVGGAPAVVEGARALVGAGALVHVVSPWLCEELEELAVSSAPTWAKQSSPDISATSSPAGPTTTACSMRSAAVGFSPTPASA